MGDRNQRCLDAAEYKSHRKLMYAYKNEVLENTRKFHLTGTRSLRNFISAYRDDPPMLDAFEQGNSPLKNEYMLEMIANFLPAQDLRNCRLVCRLFSQEFGRCLDKRTILIITDDTDPTFLKPLKDANEGVPCGISTLCAFDIRTNGSIFSKLIRTFGATLGGLKLEECNVSTESLENILMYKAPYLESLSVIEKDLTGCNMISPFSEISKCRNEKFILPDMKRLQWEDCRLTLDEIITVCPNLIELNCGGLPTPIPKRLAGAKCSFLKYLKIFPKTTISVEYLDALIALKLPLTKLVLFGVKPQGHKWMLKMKKLLESLGNTLEELQLYQDYIGTIESDCYLDLPTCLKLPELKTLILDRTLFNSFKWLNYMPKLENLECKMASLTHVDAAISRGKPKIHRALSKLTIGSIDSHSLNSLSKFFPCLTNLDVESCYADDDCLRAIIRNFSNLEVLKITKSYNLKYPSPLTDSGITGIPREACENILKGKPFKEAQAQADSLRQSPYIGNLKKLIKLKITTELCELTDLSVFYGISDIKLMMLTLPSCELTDAILDCIYFKMKPLTLLEISDKCLIQEDSITRISRQRPNMIIRKYPTI